MEFRSVAFACALFLLPVAAWAAGHPNECDVPGEAPDLVISDLFETRRHGSVSGVTAFSLGAVTCNLGSCQASYAASTAPHPVFAQNLYRLRGGQFEQVGQSWVAHRFFALSSSGCGVTCTQTAGAHLGTGCSTSDLANYAAAQTQLGPKSEVNPVTGTFPFPATNQSQQGDAVYKRLQVHDIDLDPDGNPGAVYFIEGIQVAADDAAGGGQANNASYRPVSVTETAGAYDLAFAGPTRSRAPAIAAWVEHDPFVLLRSVDVPGDGRLWVASRATPVGDGVWHYEYAVENLFSHRAARTLRVPVPTGTAPTNAGFHDVDYHSGEPIDGTDWPVGVVPGGAAVSWATTTFATNPAGNALRWGTTYSFRFDVAAPPAEGAIALGLFRPGSPQDVSATAIVPASCDIDAASFETSCDDGTSDDCDGLIDCADSDCCADPACSGLDADADGVPVCLDCDDAAPGAWSAPGETTGLTFDDRDTLSWAQAAVPGATSVVYETLRATMPEDFLSDAICVANSSLVPSVEVAENPSPGVAWFYLVRADNACPFRHGTLGWRSDGGERRGLVCR